MFEGVMAEGVSFVGISTIPPNNALMPNSARNINKAVPNPELLFAIKPKGFN
jgi:hypothetical protein